jgi:hypothetical protein
MPKKRYTLIILTFVFTLLLGTNGAHAAAPAGFGMQYGLLVHTENQNDAVPRLKGLQVLQSFFPEATLSLDDKGPISFMSQREFLISFERLRLASEGKSSSLSDDELYRRTWLDARRHNLLPLSRLTYKTLQEFLYRYSVSQAHDKRPYFEGLVLNSDEIDVSRFQSLNGIREIKGDLFSEVLTMRTLGVLSKSERQYLTQIHGYYEAFKQLEDDLRVQFHPLSQIPDMPADIKQLIVDNDLNEILESISYDYSENENYRKHNLVTGAMQISGKLFQPGEEINFTDILAEGGWGKYQFGWVIFEGKDQWQFGGGLCGSATMAFDPSWKAGLEIISRHPHSAYYHNLYPEIGLDATIYRGAKNLVMKNNTDSPVLYYVKDDTENEVVTLYVIGNSPYYSIEIEGPIETDRNTYKWIRRMQQFDGTVIEEELTSRYGLVY